MKIATYNFLHGGSRTRSGHLARVVTAFDADIVLCQEARPPEEFSNNGGQSQFFWRPVRGYAWGSGIYVRGLSASEVRVPGFSGWVTGVELALTRRTLAFSIHCPAGAGGYVQVMHRILDRLRRLRKGADLILGGDFNVAAGYRPPDDVIRFTRGERELLDRIRNEFGLVPAWQTANPGLRLAQTLRWSANRSTPYHCDGIFVPANWRIRQCFVCHGAEWESLSDHNPVFAEVAPQDMIASRAS